MVPKPDIVLYRFDPLYAATRAHLASLVARYGRPVLALDLVKQVGGISYDLVELVCEN
jgi:hypothetical protein